MSRTVKTAKGTELPIMDIRGKGYLQVAHRLVWMREEHPDWGIETELVQMNDKSAIAKATIKTAQGAVLAVAHKFENQQGFPDFLEKAETGAIGRALAMCGYGTQFTDDLDEGERLADSPTPQRAAPVSKPSPIVVKPPKAQEVQKSFPEDRETLNKRLMPVYKAFMLAYPKTIFPTILHERYQVSESKLLSLEQLSDLLDFLEAGIEAAK